jgi:hypothetical protein
VTELFQNQSYQGIVANNKKGIKELSHTNSKHFFKNRLHDSYKSTVLIPSIECFFVENVDRLLK